MTANARRLDYLGSTARRASIARPDGVTTYCAYDAIGRMNVLAHHLPGQPNHQVWHDSHDPAGQVFQLSGTNPAYDAKGHPSFERRRFGGAA